VTATRRTPAQFIAEYEHFRSYGYTHAQIADLLGVQVESVHRSADRHGVRILEPAEAAAQRVLDRLIAEGSLVTSDHLPGNDDVAVNSVLRRAVRTGRLRKVGTRRSGLVTKVFVPVYEPVAA
jgi:hypothetical protein